MGHRLGLSVLSIAYLLVGLLHVVPAAELRIDVGREAGKIRPLHGVNSGPLCCGETLDLSDFFRQMAPPLVRLHDCNWPNGDVVDVHAVFPDFRADATRPESYRFDRSDDYLRPIFAAGSNVVYRLGESIEHSKKKYHVHPPADPQQWAAICTGIISHYNERWANGFQYNIRYWEIWNEPENRPAMWTGDDEQYFRLYSTVAKAIKTRFPKLMVGGPAVGYTGSVKDGRFEPGEFVVKFLEHCKQDSAPLDFFSWHIYTNDPRAVVERAKAMRKVLDDRGFARTESHLNEWNFLPDNDWMPMLSKDGAVRQRWFERVGGPQGAAFTAATLLLLQDAPLDVGNYYSADHQGFGAFNGYGVPKKNFYALKAFKSLSDASLRLPIGSKLPAGVAACAGINADRSEVVVLLSNYAAPKTDVALMLADLPWKGPTVCDVLLLDEKRDLTRVQQTESPAGECCVAVALPPATVWLLKLRAR
jgi:hypothetical protein